VAGGGADRFRLFRSGHRWRCGAKIVRPHLAITRPHHHALVLVISCISKRASGSRGRAARKRAAAASSKGVELGAVAGGHARFGVYSVAATLYTGAGGGGGMGGGGGGGGGAGGAGESSRELARAREIWHELGGEIWLTR
jgi:hypothetical protein